MHNSHSHFKQKLLPFILLAPQLIVTIVFFLLPAFNALYLSFFTGDAFGLRTKFVWFSNFIALFADNAYLKSLIITLVFSISVAILTLCIGLLFAVLVNRAVRGHGIYKSLLIWPYAVAPAIAGILWRFIFDPAVGVMTAILRDFGIHWNYQLNGHQALLLVILAAAWQQMSYNFLFFLAGLHSIPSSLIEAAAIDGAGPFKRFKTIVFPLLSPTTFFLLVINIVYSFFDTFGIIQTVTKGGPSNATNILVYKVYNDGFVGLDIGGSSAQSVILMVIIMILTFIQFRFIEKRVHYK